jgi:Rad3-related DNA helicase
MMEPSASGLSTSGAAPKNDFPFPFTPYRIQLEFMSAVYDTLERKQIGIFESPTGTVRQYFPFFTL